MSNQTAKIIKIKTWLPIFPGFYNTCFDISNSLGQFESDLKEHGLIDKRLDWDNASFSNEVLRECCKWVAKRLPKESGVFNIKLEGVVSPKEYNFRNDSGNIELDLDIEKFSSWFNRYLNGVKIKNTSKYVSITVNKEDILNNPEKVIEEIKNEYPDTIIESGYMDDWQKHLRRHYQSRSGFISFYPSDAEIWAELTNNYRFDEKLDDDKYYRDEKIINGVHSLGRCLEFYLENEDKDARYEMYEFCSERVIADKYILNLPEFSYELLDKYNIEGLRF